MFSAVAFLVIPCFCVKCVSARSNRGRFRLLAQAVHFLLNFCSLRLHFTLLSASLSNAPLLALIDVDSAEHERPNVSCLLWAPSLSCTFPSYAPLYVLEYPALACVPPPECFRQAASLFRLLSNPCLRGQSFRQAVFSFPDSHVSSFRPSCQES